MVDPSCHDHPRRAHVHDGTLLVLLPVEHRKQVLTDTCLQECAPAFDYARASHDTKIDNSKRTAYFACPEHLDLDLRWVIAGSDHPNEGQPAPKVEVDYLDLSERGHKGCVRQGSILLCSCFRLRFRQLSNERAFHTVTA